MPLSLRAPRAALAALSLSLLPWLSSCRTATTEPAETAPPVVAARSTVTTKSEVAPATAASVADARARPDDDNLLLGNPSNALSLKGSSASRGTVSLDNLLLERPQHSMSYNAGKGGANWVSWHVGLRDLGRVGRGTFRPDPLLPTKYQIRPNDYRGSGYDRGHVCPSADRTRSREDNDATFVMSNMLPQAPALNQQVWKKLEDYSRTLVRRGSELYTIAGGEGSLGRIGGGTINVPAFCWKIIVVLPEGKDDLKRITAQTRVITVLMPNQDTPEVGGARWSKYLTNVATLEGALGYKFFSALAPDVQKALKIKIDSGRASAGDSISGVGDETSYGEDASSGATFGADAGRSPDGFSTSEPLEEAPARRAPVSEAPMEGMQGGQPYSPPLSSGPSLREQPQTEPQPATSGQVWVNTNSGIYHFPGARYYGRTKEGTYMTEAEALKSGYRAARNGQ